MVLFLSLLFSYIVTWLVLFLQYYFWSQNSGHLFTIRRTHNGSQIPKNFIFGAGLIKGRDRTILEICLTF